MSLRLLTLALLLTGCSPQRFFYYPNRVMYHDPDRMNVTAETVSFSTDGGPRLTGLWLRASGTPKGTLLHLHGNFGNVSNHFPQALFLVQHGFDVLSIDYRGYGGSEGRPTAQGLVEDGLTAADYAMAHRRDRAPGLGLFGQSLGGAVGIVTAAKDPRIAAAVIEAAFTSHASMTRAALGRHVWLWPFYPILPLFVNRSQDPLRWVEHIAPRPVLFIHGEADEIVPVDMSRRLFAKAGEPKSLWTIPSARHLGIRSVGRDEYENRIAGFFEASLAVKSSTPAIPMLPGSGSGVQSMRGAEGVR